MTKTEIRKTSDSELIRELCILNMYATVKQGTRCIGVLKEINNIGNELIDRNLLTKEDLDKIIYWG